MNCDTTSFGSSVSSFFYGFMFAEVVCLGVYIYIDKHFEIVRGRLLDKITDLMNKLTETQIENEELEHKLSRVYNSFETFKSELVGLEKYDDMPELIPVHVPPPAERTETYFDNNSIPAGLDEYEKVDQTT